MRLLLQRRENPFLSCLKDNGNLRFYQPSSSGPAGQETAGGLVALKWLVERNKDGLAHWRIAGGAGGTGCDLLCGILWNDSVPLR